MTVSDIADWCTIGALLVAAWQIGQQRKEVARGNRLTALIHVSHLLDRQIDQDERIIENLRQRRENWTGLAKKVNSRLNPAKKAVDAALLENLLVHAPGAVDRAELRALLRVENGDVNGQA